MAQHSVSGCSNSLHKKIKMESCQVEDQDLATGNRGTPASPSANVGFSLLQLPSELVREHILSKLDGLSLVMLEMSNSAFRAHDPVARLSMTEAIARDLVWKSNGDNKDTSVRWR